MGAESIGCILCALITVENEVFRLSSFFKGFIKRVHCENGVDGSVPKYDSEYKKAKTVSRLRPFVNRIRDNQEPNLQSPFFDNVYQHYDVADGSCA